MAEELERSVLEAARAGDAKAFDDLVRPHRRAVAAHCYRMLGSLADADDAVQETLVRAWKGLAGWQERASLRGWLHRIATNVCIDMSAARKRRVLPNDMGAALAPGERPQPSSADDVPWLEPAPPELWEDDNPEAHVRARESVRIAFMCALQRLPASQRAALLLRDVLGWSAEEVAEALETTVPAVNSLLQRARATIESRPIAQPRDEASLRALLERYMRAWESGAPDAFATVLRDDAILTMPPMAAWFAGRAAIADFVAWVSATTGGFRCAMTTLSGGPAVAIYSRVPGEDRWVASSIHVLVADGDRASEVHAFLLPELFERLGLPASL